jgi:hypothetical protein
MQNADPYLAAVLELFPCDRLYPKRRFPRPVNLVPCITPQAIREHRVQARIVKTWHFQP